MLLMKEKFLISLPTFQLSIATLGLQRRLQTKLLSKGYYFLEDVLQHSPETLATSLDVSISTAKKIISQLDLEYDTPQIQRLEEMIQEQNIKIPTTLSSLDISIGGGFTRCSITEISGPSGSGKSLLLRLLTQSHPLEATVFLSTQSSPSTHFVSHYTQVAQWFDYLLTDPPHLLLLDNIVPLLTFQDKLVQSRWLHRWGMVLRQLCLKHTTVIFTSQSPSGGIAGTLLKLQCQEGGRIIARLERSISGIPQSDAVYTIDDLVACIRN